VTNTAVEVEATVVVVDRVMEVVGGSEVVDVELVEVADVINDVEVSVVNEVGSVALDVTLDVDSVAREVVVTGAVVVPVSVVTAEDVEARVEAVGGDDVVDSTVMLELSIGETVTALAAAILEATPITANKRIRANATRTGTDFIQLSLLFTNGCQDWNGTFSYACYLRV